MVHVSRLFHNFLRSLKYFKRKGYLNFIGWNVVKIAMFYAVVIGVIVLLGKFLLDLDRIFHLIVERFSDFQILLLFFVSESILGMIPPDLFMLWTSKFQSPLIFLVVLGILSFLGGIVAYLLGQQIAKNKRVARFTEKRLQKYIQLTRKWGGAFISIAALFPFSPYGTVVLAVSLLKYPFERFLWFGLFRIARFVIQGMVMVKLINLGF